ncbi:50S ribosomal protein L21 [Caulobacter sp. SLTY]|nr:50S ribosomal protein L21 [Caulobacter sp. SLTY]NBB16758.1 50S ribosomal protein L21 [Caulobacter sp. SLTY]
MYAVIKTGGKQYRVSPGDLLVVEKLAGEPGAEVSFDQVLMLGDGDTVTVGAPMVAGAAVTATLVETRKGEKVKVFKKIRRQGYRRTRGHRQQETVLRVTAIGDAKWDGKVDLTTKAELNARSRGLKLPEFAEKAEAAPAPAPAPKKATKAKAVVTEEETIVAAEAPVVEAAAAAPEVEVKDEAPKAKKAAAPKAAKAEDGDAAPAKKAAPKKAAKKDADEA